MKESESGLWVDDVPVEAPGYRSFHARRVRLTLEQLAEVEAQWIVELGSHPWVMTAALLTDSRFEVAATISAEEVTRWPDEIPVSRRMVRLRAGSREYRFPNYSANVERTNWAPLGVVTSSNPFRRRSPTAGYRCHVYERHSFLFTREGLADLVELCGFRIRSLGYWNVYPCQGWSRLMRPLTQVPLDYFQAKFQKTIFLVAEKERETRRLDRLPSVYHPSQDWEWIGPGAPGEEASS